MSPLFENGDALLRAESGYHLYRSPSTIITTHALGDVWPALLEVERAVNAGRTAVGWVAYEAAPVFDAALEVHPTDEFPLLWFALYDRPVSPTWPAPACLPPLSWNAAWDEEVHASKLGAIRNYLAAGDTYQVNLTFPMTTRFEGNPLDCFLGWQRQQATPYGMAIQAGRWSIASISPELFFELDGARIITRPMKGTRRRGKYPEEDKRIAQELRACGKDLAENVMITDLLRNDLGRVARTGSVHVPELFTLERYPTLWQLTSTIEARTDASVPEIFRALFPCGSVTGAPKVRAMQIIRELETAPRGIYCGAMGTWEPGRKARFSVAIRTATFDHAQGIVQYPVGSGITWDSKSADEYSECIQKASVVTEASEPFELLETLLFEDGQLALLDLHLERLSRSAEYFGIPVSLDRCKAALATAIVQQASPARVRLLVAETGEPRIEVSALSPMPECLTIALHAIPLHSDNHWLYHKTTQRRIYAEAHAAHPGCDDVLLQNEREELTESCYGNVVVTLDGAHYTPPLECGLLAGCFREALLRSGEVQTRVIPVNELHRADEVRIINSVRGWMKTAFVEPF